MSNPRNVMIVDTMVFIYGLLGVTEQREESLKSWSYWMEFVCLTCLVARLSMWLQGMSDLKMSPRNSDYKHCCMHRVDELVSDDVAFFLPVISSRIWTSRLDYCSLVKRQKQLG